MQNLKKGNMGTVFMTYSKAKRNRTIFLIALSFLLLTNCNNSTTTEQWQSIKDEKNLNLILLFASQNLNNSFCDSAISYLSDTSSQSIIDEILFKDSVDLKNNSIIVYPAQEYYSEYQPPYLDRVAFRIHIKEKDSIIVNDIIFNLEEIENELIKFIQNKNNLDSLPPKKSIKYNEDWAEIETTLAVVEIYCNIYGAGDIQDNLIRTTEVIKKVFDAYDSIRKQRSKDMFDTNFDNLDSQKKDIIRTMNPLKLYIKPNVFLHYYPYFFNPPPTLSTDDIIRFNSTLKNE